MLSHTLFGKSLSLPSGDQNKPSALEKVETGHKKLGMIEPGAQDYGQMSLVSEDNTIDRKMTQYKNMQFYENNVAERQWIYNVWMKETTQRIIKLLVLLLSDLLIKRCSYQTSL